jgi:hypothetical protein
MSRMPSEVILDLPHPVLPMAHVRSTLLLGSIMSLREAGYADAYFAIAPRELREAAETAVAGMWLPIEIGLAHYRTCDALDMSIDSAMLLGRSTFTRTKGVLLGTAISLARGVGVTPWTLVPHFQRFWMRGYDGGGVRVVKRGPKELTIELVQCPPLASRYYRAALRGLAAGLLELVCTRAYVHEVALRHGDTAILLRVQWA